MYTLRKNQEPMSKIVIIECKQCGKSKKCYPSRIRQFCSIECKNASAKRVSQDCIKCGKRVNMLKSTFERQHKSNTCGRECYKAIIQRDPKPCAQCGEGFIPSDPRTLTCGKPCFLKYCKENWVRRHSEDFCERVQ